MQVDHKAVKKAKKGDSVAISLPHLTLGRQVKEGDILYVDVPEKDFRAFKRLKNYLKDDEVQTLKEIADIHRKTASTWGI